MASGGKPSKLPKGNDANAEQEAAGSSSFDITQTTVQTLSDELRQLRVQWETMEENSVEDEAVMRLDKCIFKMEALNRKVIEGNPDAQPELADEARYVEPATVAANLHLQVLQRESRYSELQMDIHESEMMISELKGKIMSVGRRNHPAMRRAVQDEDERSDMLLLMLCSVQNDNDPPEQRIEALDRRNAELEIIVRDQKRDIAALSAALRE